MAAEGVCLDHISRETSNLKALANFYQETLGFERIEAPKFTEFELVWLRLSPSLTLHLIERDPESNLVLRESASSVVRDPSKCPRQNHLGFGVSNYNQFVASLKKNGIQIHECVRPDGKTKQAFFFDPEGNGLEVFSL
ncbi:hypothetical protein ZOSMA_116G00830 [Zostera marina]|uniref:VOC domain-containing protein n=1 Tax=Zostera marina TaxID=29655 RepID=A0A0K9Q238_ZOSMR|nr:hypothetical protein ZOSMA_116G00830 [Zostera marina]